MKKALLGLLAALAGGIIELGSARRPAGISLAGEQRQHVSTEAAYAQRPAADSGRRVEARNLRTTIEPT
jgi:hypothetical protein